MATTDAAARHPYTLSITINAESSDHFLRTLLEIRDRVGLGAVQGHSDGKACGYRFEVREEERP